MMTEYHDIEFKCNIKREKSMKLKQYLKDNYIQQKALVDKLGISATHANALVHERTTPTLEIAYAIEKFTKGKVTVYDWLRENV